MLINKQEVNPSSRILHVNDIARAYYSKKEQLETASPFAYLGTALAKKEDRLAECARISLKLGDVKQYCETMISLRNLARGENLLVRRMGKGHRLRPLRFSGLLAELC